MKRLLLLLPAFMSLSIVNAQTYAPFSAASDIDVGNIRAAHLMHGDMYWDPASAMARCEFPKGSGKHIASNNDFWLGGIDAQGLFKGNGELYRKTSQDFWPGTVDNVSTTSAQAYARSSNWARIWRVSSTDLTTFRATTTHTALNTPADIWEWPAIGNPNAKGASSALTISFALAPFVDVNGDGIYNAASGDYPRIKGDQMLWYVINDKGPVRGLSHTNAVGIDIAIEAYAYSRHTVLDNVIFYEYDITNRGTMSLDSVSAGQFTDFNIGDASDDYIGFDSSRRLAIVYNGKPTDGTGRPTDYGAMPPSAGMILLEQPGDAYPSLKPAGSFTVPNPSSTLNGDPQNMVEAYYLLHSQTRLQAPYTNGSAYGPYTPTWECDVKNMPGDRRGVTGTTVFRLLAGTTKKIAFALVAADSTGGCPNADFSKLLATADTALKVYYNPPRSLSVGNLPATSFSIYPNPASSVLYLEGLDGSTVGLKVYNAVGSEIPVSFTRSRAKLSVNIASLPPGLYTLRCADKTGMHTAVFMKP